MNKVKNKKNRKRGFYLYLLFLSVFPKNKKDDIRYFCSVTHYNKQFVKAEGSSKQPKALKTRFFSTKKYLAENFRFLRGFDKPLAFRRIDSICKQKPMGGSKKSTPKKNLALPFSFLACSQKRKMA